MPLYEYCCVACHAKEERLTGYSSPTMHDCPVCGKSNGMQRQLSVPSISFSGGGWYAQGYSKDNNPPPCSANKSAVADSPPVGVGHSGKGNCADCVCNHR
jgi:putative FmdB family regulatory protein